MLNKGRPRTRTVLSTNVRRLMADRQWTQQDLATRSGVSQKTVSMVLREEVAATIETTDALAKAFNVDAWTLLMPPVESNIDRAQELASMIRTLQRASTDDRETLIALFEKFSGK